VDVIVPEKQEVPAATRWRRRERAAVGIDDDDRARG
jgi:hypothetical protein